MSLERIGYRVPIYQAGEGKLGEAERCGLGEGDLGDLLRRLAELGEGE
jgi:hypothetical protein